MLVTKPKPNTELVESSAANVSADPKLNSSYLIQIVPWVQEKNIAVLDQTLDNENFSDKIDSCEFRKQFLSSFIHDDVENILTSDSATQEKRRKIVKNYLLAHQLSVDEDDNDNLVVQDLVTIHAPYTSVDCKGTNQIVLDRIRNLISQCDL